MKKSRMRVIYEYYRNILVKKNEKIKKRRKKYFDTLKLYGKAILTIIQILAAVGTVVAPVATLVTVAEMRNERNQLYKPQMICETSHYSDDYERLSGVFDVRNLMVIQEEDDKFPVLETSIYNVGSGAALDIEIKFVLDNYKEYVKAITRYYDEKIDINECSYTLHYNGMKYTDYAYKDDLVIKKPYLLSGESVEITIPQEFRKLLYCLNRCTIGDYELLPTIHLQISYIDLQGIQYSNDYNLIINTEISSSELGDRYFHVDYNIEQGYYTNENEAE